MEQFPSVANDPPPMRHEEFGIGNVLGRGFSIFFRNLPAFLVISAITYVPLLAYGLTWSPYDANTLGELQSGLLKYALISFVGAMLLQNLAVSAITFGVVEEMRGRHAGIGRCLAVGLRRMLPALGVTLLAGLCVLLGVLALIVGAVVVFCMLYVAVPASVIEQNGVSRALSRSAYLTKGNRWNIFGLIFVLGVIGAIVNWGVQAALIDKVGDVVPPDQWNLYVGIQFGIQFAMGALGATIAAVAYVQLRNDKDGVGVGELAKVFE